MTSLPNGVTGQYVVLETVSGERLRDVRGLPNPSPADAPPGVVFPYGFFSYEQYFGPVTFHLPGIHTAYNFGPTYDRPFDHWYRVPESDLDIGADRIVLQGLSWITIFGPAVILPGAGTTIIVNATDDGDDEQPDNGHMTLREAINRANFLPGKDTIVFNIPGTGPHTIQPASVLPWITDTVVVDGYTQPGAVPATDDEPAVIMIELDGSRAGSGDGLNIAAHNSTIRGLCVNRFKSSAYGWSGNQLVLSNRGALIEGTISARTLPARSAITSRATKTYSHGASSSSTRTILSGARHRQPAI